MGQRYALWVQLVETPQAEDEGEQPFVGPSRVVSESPQAGLILRRDQGDPLGLPVALDVTTATLPETLVVHSDKTRKFIVSGEEVEAESGARVGSWIPYSNMRRRWVSAVAGTKYAWVTFKTFRKAVAKLLTEEYDLRTAQEQLGHASQTTTETFYVGLNTEAPKVAETLERFFKESTPSPKTG